MNRNKTIAALDIGSSKIATLIAQVSEEGNINIIGSSSLPSRGIKRGQIIDIEEATEAIIASAEAAERMAGYNLGHIFVSVGGTHIISQNSRGVVAVANSGNEIVENDIHRVLEAAQAISLPALREILHVISRLYTVDSQEGIADPIGMSGIRLEVETHIITASSTAIHNLQKCVNEVGANIDGIVFDALASANAVLTPTEKELGVTLIDIGGGTTSIIIFNEGSPIFSLVLPMGAQNITNDLAIGLRLSIEEAEKLKLALNQKTEDLKEIDFKKLGIENKDQKITKKMVVEEIIKPRLEELFGMISDEIRRNDFSDIAPAGVVLTGGGAQTISAVETCRRVMALPVRIGIPKGVTGLVDDILSPEFATTIGLILWEKQDTLKEQSFSFDKVKKRLPNLPIRSTLEKTIKFIKSFLP
ncbi:cell division protein FtsA [Candidatus Shapirobacteria bacterium CG09_land_8_20_14_0_10_38_17]|uniref:Cell division protein FtsA n=1 Tax=Candidatus Shapirobacteria bacterium CG09_land_8_20_14_0_10_38_17 TaxID=1974884 RepID=A0A2H0WQU2_9BACT|nr:MAG: cell division protein FtsA [Candidatus Shapirobacteria bacterium CG09_land_8_20_14_0_10_38_17]